MWRATSRRTKADGWNLKLLRLTSCSVAVRCSAARSSQVSSLPPAIDAELPHRIQLSAAARAMLGREILPAVRAVDHLAALGQRPSAELAALDLGRQRGGPPGGGRSPVPPAVAVAAGVATGIL